MKSPLISVVIPTRHRNDSLALCLDRLAPNAQMLSAEQYDVIVTDDDSVSTAEAMVRARYPWARWVAGPRRGPACNRNNGAAHANGEWVAFADDDCVPGTGWLAAYAQAIRPGFDVYEGKTTCEAGLRSPLEHAPINLTGGWLWSCNMMVRTSLFRAMSGFDEDFPYPHMEDTDFRERLGAAGVPFEFVPEAVVDHPPRRVALFRKVALHHECEVIHSFKAGRRPTLLAILVRTARARLQALRRYPISLDSLAFGASALAELLWCTMYFQKWVRKCERAQRTGGPRAA